ncbi:MAG: cation:proton antiporter, partial [Candidatus Omnitrophota bacterium]
MKKIFLTLLFLVFVFVGSASASQGGEGFAIIDQMAFLVFQLGFILFAAKIGAIVFDKLKMPEILGELIAGMVIGPYFLGGIHLPFLNSSLFPFSTSFPISVELYGFMTVASIVLLFMVGLETNLEIFLRYSFAGSLVGIGGVLFSFLLGDFCTVIFSKSLFGMQFSFMDPIPLFLGVISTATSVGISARILSDKKMMQSPEGVTIISGAIIDDVLGVILLAVVLLIAKSENVKWAQIGVIALRSILLWVVFTVLGLVFSFKISGFLKKFKDTSTISVLALGMALMLAGIFERGGLAMIIGAYVMGLSLSKTDLVYVIQERLIPLQRFFVPMFFCIMGMMVDCSALFSKNVLFFGVIYALLGVVGKVVGCGLPVMFSNFNLRGALRIGLGMTPRGEVALIITGIGIAAGILEKDLIAAVIAMLLLNTLLSPAALAASLRSKKSGVKKLIPSKHIMKEIRFGMPTSETTDLVLSRILPSFAQEGFFVQKIETDKKLFQIRKEQTCIGLDVAEDALVFECMEDDVVYVHTLVYEVLVDLENNMKYLKTLTNRQFEARKEF